MEQIFLRDLYDHMIRYGLTNISNSDLFNKSFPNHFDPSVYDGLTRPYMYHINVFGKELFDITNDKHGVFLVSPKKNIIRNGNYMSSQRETNDSSNRYNMFSQIATRYPGRNIQVHMMKKQESVEYCYPGSASNSVSSSGYVDRIPGLGNVPISGSASSVVGISSLSSSVESNSSSSSVGISSSSEYSRKRPLDNAQEVVAKRPETETSSSMNDIRLGIYMLQKIQELENVVLENKARKSDLEEKIRIQLQQISALEAISSKRS